MVDYAGPERRHNYVQLDDQLIALLRRVVREELETAASDGRLLSDTDKHDVRAWLASRKAQTERRDRLVSNTLGWLVIVGISGIGYAVWEWIKTKIHQP